MKTYSKAVEEWLEQADWITEEHGPAVTGLQQVAAFLDTGFNAQAFSQYGVLFRWLMKQAPSGEEDDGLEDLLDN